jgi:hypothetical protein
MAWGTDFPLAELAQHLMDTRLRVERLRLGQRLQSLESRAALLGLPTKDLRDLRRSLRHTGSQAPDRVDTALVLPRKPKGVWRQRYLAVQLKPGSVF